LVVIRGAGEMASGAAYRLYRAGFRVILLERECPTAIRRSVVFSEAVFEGSKVVEGVRAELCNSVPQALALADEGACIPMLIDPEARSVALLRPDVIVDGRMLKRDPGPGPEGAEACLRVGLGPGHVAGTNCDLVVETERGHTLGRVIERGPALPYSGRPGEIGGWRSERVVRAPVSGTLRTHVEIGDDVTVGAVLVEVEGVACRASIAGRVRGLLRDGSRVVAGQKIGDVDPRGALVDHTLISDKARAVGGGVLEAVLGWMSGRIGLPRAGKAQQAGRET